MKISVVVLLPRPLSSGGAERPRHRNTSSYASPRDTKKSNQITVVLAAFSFIHPRYFYGCLSQLRLLQQNTIDWEGLNNRNLFFTVLETGKPKIKLPADLVPGEACLSGLQKDVFLLHPHIAEGEMISLCLLL